MLDLQPPRHTPTFMGPLRVKRVRRGDPDAIRARISVRNQVASFRRRPWQGRGRQEPVTGSTFIRSGIPASAGAATPIPFAAGVALRGTGPFSTSGILSPVGVRSHIRPAFPAVASRAGIRNARRRRSGHDGAVRNHARRASATTMMRRIRPVAPSVRLRNHWARSLSGCQSSQRQLIWIM